MGIDKRKGYGSGPRFDGILKAVFREGAPTVLNRLTGGIPVVRWLNPETPRVQGRRADLVVMLRDGTILHIEFQTSNDPDMTLRMIEYWALLYRAYRRPIRQIVVYVGAGRPNMTTEVGLLGMNFGYELFDVRSMDARTLLRSAKPGDVALAVLAGGGPALFGEIVRRAGKVTQGRALSDLLAEIEILGQLRGVDAGVKLEARVMPDVIEINPDSRLGRMWRQAEERGIEQGRAGAMAAFLKAKFGRLPQWAKDRVAEASPSQIERWTVKLLKAETIEDVLGPREAPSPRRVGKLQSA